MAKTIEEPKEGKKAGRGRPAGVAGKKKRKNKKNADSYAIYIRRVLRQVHPEVGITKTSMTILNSFVGDMFERVAKEASFLVRKGKSQTLTAREIQTSVRLNLPGELAKHAVSEGTKAVTKISEYGKA